ncbi:MAG: hypothetical protein CVV30_12050 [Methanomicrobiales archaeon HGW-Methanomicrobiales-1]|nr:MAG: hypothetical protein CVV30_12050 [Methanomicrobiales archaeon HGW-Methanomicrobiales-1]
MIYRIPDVFGPVFSFWIQGILRYYRFFDRQDRKYPGDFMLWSSDFPQTLFIAQAFKEHKFCR